MNYSFCNLKVSEEEQRKDKKHKITLKSSLLFTTSL